MKLKILYLLCLSILAAPPAFSQTRSVTNADLEKYRQKRLQAEKDYRENYAKMGFPSPEELERQIEKNRVEREQLSARLAAERIQRESAEAEREALVMYSEQMRYQYPDGPNLYRSGYSAPYPSLIYFGGSRFPINGRHYGGPRHHGNGIPVFGNLGNSGTVFINGPRTRRSRN